MISEEWHSEILLKTQAFYQIGMAFKEIGKLNEAIVYLEDGVLRARRIENNELDALTMQALAQIYHKLGDLNEAKEMWFYSLEKYKLIQNKEQMGKVLNDLGYLYVEKDEFKRAISSFKYSLKIQQENNDSNLPTTLLQLAKLYLQIDPDKAQFYCKESVDALLKDLGYRFSEEQEEQLAHGFFVMGLCCREKNDKKNMLMFLEKSLGIYKKFRMKPQWEEVYQVYQKYGPIKMEQRYNGTNEVVHELARYFHKSIG